MPVNLPEIAHNERMRILLRANSFNARLGKDQILYCLSHMGEVMSTFKLSRKVAVVAVILYEMEVGQVMSAHHVCALANEKYLQSRQSITPTIVGSIMRLCEKWGLVERIRVQSNHYVYRKVITNEEE